MKDLTINESIRSATVRLIDEQGGAVVISRSEALALARAQNEDLVLIAESDPPVCRILNADRFRYERKRDAREQKRKQRDLAVETKEVQLRPVTDEHDIAIKARRARGFLDEGDKLKVVVRFRGRERSHREQGEAIMAQFLAALGEHKVERPMAAGGEMMVLIAPMVSKAELYRTAQASREAPPPADAR